MWCCFSSFPPLCGVVFLPLLPCVVLFSSLSSLVWCCFLPHHFPRGAVSVLLSCCCSLHPPSLRVLLRSAPGLGGASLPSSLEVLSASLSFGGRSCFFVVVTLVLAALRKTNEGKIQEHRRAKKKNTHTIMKIDRNT